MKKVIKTQPEHRPYCKPQRRQKIINRPAEEILCKTERKSMMAAQLKPRPLVDCPFYNLKYKFDELPLDPVKEFIIEKISHMQSNAITGRCNKELEFHQYDVENVEMNDGDNDEGDNLLEVQLEDIVMPQKFEMMRNKKLHFYGFNVCDDPYPWLNKYLNAEKPTEESVFAVTQTLLDVYCQRRVRVFYFNCRTKSAMFTNELKKLHAGPSDVIGGYNAPTAKRLRLPALKPPPKIKKFKAGDHYALRTPEECRIELARMDKVIDELIAPTLQRSKTGFNQQRSHSLDENSNSQKSKNKKPIKRIKSVLSRKNFKTNEEFLIHLKSLEKEKFKYLEGFQPVDPEEQKALILQKYYNELHESTKKFTPKVERRYKCLMNHLSVLSLETFPSKLIKKVLPNISRKLQFLQDAYKFVCQEEKLWPKLHIEVMLMDYLFTSERQIPTDVAVLIISCLIDLQEDYRYYVKRAFIRYLLR
ncbi:uncharacterized protein ACRADG_003223 [Cochliomyia hominivorax]